MSNQERNRRTYKKTHQKHIAYKIKGSHFVVLDRYSYTEKIDHQLERSYLQQLDYNTSDTFCKHGNKTRFLTTVGADLLRLFMQIQVKCMV